MTAPAALKPGRILRAAELGQHLAADAVVQAAERQAAAIRAEAKRAGFAEGRAEGLAAATRMVAETAAELRRQSAALERALAEAIADGVAAVLGSVPAPERVAMAAAHALAGINERGRLLVRVPPDAAEAVRARLDGAAEQLTVLADPALTGDRCVVEGPGGSTDAGIPTQLSALRAALGLPA